MGGQWLPRLQARSQQDLSPLNCPWGQSQPNQPCAGPALAELLPSAPPRPLLSLLWARGQGCAHAYSELTPQAVGLRAAVRPGQTQGSLAGGAGAEVCQSPRVDPCREEEGLTRLPSPQLLPSGQ